MLVDAGVQKAVKSYHPDLVVKYNPEWDHDTNRFWICQRVQYMREVDERIGLFEELEWEYPVLGVDQATTLDRRWFEALDENRWDNIRPTKEILKEQSDRRRKAIRESAYDWAKDVGWWHMKKQYADFSASSAPRRGSRFRGLEEYRQRTGKEVPM